MFCICIVSTYFISQCSVCISVCIMQAHHLRCLNDFVEAQATYYAQCYQYMVDLQKQLGRYKLLFINPFEHFCSSL